MTEARPAHQATGEEKAPINHLVLGRRGGVEHGALNLLLGGAGKPPGSGPRIVKHKAGSN